MDIRVRYYSIFFILFVGVITYAQNIPIIPIQNAQWDYRSIDPGGGYHYHQYTINDTIIDSALVLRYGIDRYEDTHNPAGAKFYGHSEFLLIIDEGKILLKVSDTELLLFDSNWMEGDTISDPQYESAFVVESIDTVEVGGVQRRKWNFISVAPELEGFNAGFIEGIGNTKYNSSYPAYFMYWEGRSSLECCYINDEYVITDYCKYSTNTEVFSQASPIRLYPNPSSGSLFIESEHTYSNDATLSILDVNGRLIHTQIISQLSEKIEISNLLSGLYLVKILDGNTEWQKLLLIQ